MLQQQPVLCSLNIVADISDLSAQGRANWYGGSVASISEPSDGASKGHEKDKTGYNKTQT